MVLYRFELIRSLFVNNSIGSGWWVDGGLDVEYSAIHIKTIRTHVSIA